MPAKTVSLAAHGTKHTVDDFDADLVLRPLYLNEIADLLAQRLFLAHRKNVCRSGLVSSDESDVIISPTCKELGDEMLKDIRIKFVEVILVAPQMGNQVWIQGVFGFNKISRLNTENQVEFR